MGIQRTMERSVRQSAARRKAMIGAVEIGRIGIWTSALDRCQEAGAYAVVDYRDPGLAGRLHAAALGRLLFRP